MVGICALLATTFHTHEFGQRSDGYYIDESLTFAYAISNGLNRVLTKIEKIKLTKK